MRRRTGFLLGILFELLAIFGLFAPYAIFVSNGTEIVLRTVPVDPRSIFRGDYVTLGYEAGANVPYSNAFANDTSSETTVYLTLEKKGETYERVAASVTKPVLKEGQVCLRGYTWAWYGDVPPKTVTVNIPDIAQYFVEEGLGRELESARNANRLLVTAIVSPSCTSVVKGVHLGQEVPLSELPVVPGFIEEKPEPVTPVL